MTLCPLRTTVFEAACHHHHWASLLIAAVSVKYSWVYDAKHQSLTRVFSRSGWTWTEKTRMTKASRAGDPLHRMLFSSFTLTKCSIRNFKAKSYFCSRIKRIGSWLLGCIHLGRWSWLLGHVTWEGLHGTEAVVRIAGLRGRVLLPLPFPPHDQSTGGATHSHLCTFTSLPGGVLHQSPRGFSIQACR